MNNRLERTSGVVFLGGGGSPGARVTITDSLFHGNYEVWGGTRYPDNSYAFVLSHSGMLTLKGCNDFGRSAFKAGFHSLASDDTPTAVNDEGSGPPCAHSLPLPLPSSSRDCSNDDCYERPQRMLGGSASIFRQSTGANTVLRIFDVDADSEGTLALSVEQSQVAAVTWPACVLATDNGRIAVIVSADGNVTVSVGPDFERKIHHVVFGGGLGGSVIGTHTTYSDDPPGLDCPKE